MNTHEHPELLSAYVDGELFGDERAQVEAHVAVCATCAPTVEALRATLGDLRLLDEPEPSAFESRMLRQRLAAARRRPARLVRAAAALSGVAAVIAGFVVFAGGGLEDRASLSGGQAGTFNAPEEVSRQFSKRSVNALAIEGPGADYERGTGSTAGVGPQGMEAQTADDAATLQSGSTCETESATDDRSRYLLEASYVGTFQEQPAHVFVYLTPAASPTHREVWVFAQSDCRLMYWRQHPLG